MKRDIIEYLDVCCRIASKKGLKLVLTIHRTNNSLESQRGFTTAVRITDSLLICGLCNISADLIQCALEEYGRSIEYIFVDVEKKGDMELSSDFQVISTGNTEDVVARFFDRKQIRALRVDAITAEAVVDLTLEKEPFIYESKIALIGLGSIGARVALSLIQCGCNINIHCRDSRKAKERLAMIEGLKGELVLARGIIHRRIETCISKADVVIVCTNSERVLDGKQALCMKEKASVLSVGHGEMSQEFIEKCNSRNIDVLRFDCGPFLVSRIESILRSERYKGGRVCVNNEFRLVSHGFPGREGDIVVDDAYKPTLEYGRVDKDGRFERGLKEYRDDA